MIDKESNDKEEIYVEINKNISHIVEIDDNLLNWLDNKTMIFALGQHTSKKGKNAVSVVN